LAHAAAAYCYVWLKVNRYVLMMGEQEVAATLRHVSRAVERGQDDASALGLAGLALAYVGFDLDGAVSLLDKALKLNPNLASAWHWSGWVRCYLGEPDTAIEHLVRAMRLSPLDPLFYGMEAATAWSLRRSDPMGRQGVSGRPTVTQLLAYRRRKQCAGRQS
jgi:tetratricopeptide (TPR) repeat protein